MRGSECVRGISKGVTVFRLSIQHRVPHAHTNTLLCTRTHDPEELPLRNRPKHAVENGQLQQPVLVVAAAAAAAATWARSLGSSAAPRGHLNLERNIMPSQAHAGAWREERWDRVGALVVAPRCLSALRRVLPSRSWLAIITRSARSLLRPTFVPSAPPRGGRGREFHVGQGAVRIRW